MSEAVKTLRPFFSYYGGKWRDALRLYPEPEFETIVESFAGSAGYSLRYPNKRIILYEVDPIVASVWKFLIAAKPKDILRIPDLPPGGTCDDLKISQEARWLVGFWLNRGTASPRKSASRWMRDRIRPGSFWGDRVRNTIASQVDLIRHWEIHNGSYDECPDYSDVTWFIDPPYQEAGRHYQFGSETIDYTSLASWCRGRDGQTIVCENSGATWLPFRELATTKTTRSRRSKEVYWLDSFSSRKNVLLAKDVA